MPKIGTPKPAEIELSEEQGAAVERLLSFPKMVQTLGGYAGTGKTTVIKTIAKRLPRFAVAAYTGKAANVLRRKGVRASTIHQAIYKPVEVELKDAMGRRKVVFEYLLKSPDEIEELCSGFIVDEASMVDERIYRDLRSFGLPIILVGDHGQLPPIHGNFNVMERPDVTLERIHRNAGEIAHFANFLRQGGHSHLWPRHNLCTGERVRLETFRTLAGNDPDQIIVAFNKTRVWANKLAREHYGHPPDDPVVGDRVMCLRNDHALGVFNGMQGEVAKLDLAKNSMVFRVDGKDYKARFIPEQFNATKTLDNDPVRRACLPFDYCYAITCHKAQGDEWNNVRCSAFSGQSNSLISGDGGEPFHASQEACSAHAESSHLP